VTKKPGPPPPLPHLTREQLRDLIVAERAGVKPDCVLCGQPVLEQTFTLGPGDEAQRMLINSPCGHAMTYGRQLAEQIAAAVPAGPATEATEATGGTGWVETEESDCWLPKTVRRRSNAVLKAVADRFGAGKEVGQ
jgi:hypothetical protein